MVIDGELNHDNNILWGLCPHDTTDRKRHGPTCQQLFFRQQNQGVTAKSGVKPNYHFAIWLWPICTLIEYTITCDLLQ